MNTKRSRGPDGVFSNIGTLDVLTFVRTTAQAPTSAIPRYQSLDRYCLTCLGYPELRLWRPRRLVLSMHSRCNACAGGTSLFTNKRYHRTGYQPTSGVCRRVHSWSFPRHQQRSGDIRQLGSLTSKRWRSRHPSVLGRVFKMNPRPYGPKRLGRIVAIDGT